MVVSNGQTFSRKNILAGVSRGSVLVPLLFFIYIDGLPSEIESISELFADDTEVFSKVETNFF